MSWWKTAKVGDKVVCVTQPLFPQFGGMPVKHELNKVYTITEIIARSWFSCGVGLNVGLKGSNGGKVYTDAVCFRPLESRPTDISIFTALLTSTEILEGADHD